MDLEATLARVSRHCLRGQPVPGDLRALWQAKLGGRADLLDGAELTLVDEVSEQFLAGCGEATGAAPAAAGAHRRMLGQIAFVALTMDGLLGYWLGEADRPVDAAPVVELDGEGQYALKGSSMAEFLLQLSEVPEDFALVRDWLTEHGIPIAVHSREDVLDRLKGFEDPNAVWSRYLQEEQAPGS